MNRFPLFVCCLMLMLTLIVLPANAQNFTGDARLVAMGGIGGHANDAMSLAGNARSYHSIGLPIGLFQVLKNTNIFNPSDKEFNPMRAIELASSPLHYTFALGENSPGEVLVRDLVNGKISRDLNSYRGFAPKPETTSKGLISPTFGRTFRVQGDKNGPSQGVYVGAGPYIALGTNLNIDQQLINVLGNSGNTPVPSNTTFHVANTSDGQVAGALTFGYRARFALPQNMTSLSGSSDRDGIYVSANYNYLRGIRRDSAAINVQFDTDANGLITLAPTTTPLTVLHAWSEKGKGLAIDLGTAVVVNRWELNFAANGVGNYIDWEDHSLESLTLNSILAGASFTTTPLPASNAILRLKLPVQYVGGGAYHTDRWTASSEFGKGLQNFEYRGGVEYRFAIFELRGGEHYKNHIWSPGIGAGLNLTRHFGIDAAIYGNANNAERLRKPALALSLRFGGE
jgi:hypothetical protein